MANKVRYKTSFGFIDLLFNLLVGFVFLFILAFILINPVAKRADFEPKAEYILVVTWDKSSKNDIDIWIRDNLNNIVGFRNRDLALINLDRDDLGQTNDFYTDNNGNQVLLETNREVVSIRSSEPRIYNFTLHFYAKKGEVGSETVRVELVKVNPYRTVDIREVILEAEGVEKPLYELEVFGKKTYELRNSDKLIVNNTNNLRKKF